MSKIKAYKKANLITLSIVLLLSLILFSIAFALSDQYIQEGHMPSAYDNTFLLNTATTTNSSTTYYLENQTATNATRTYYVFNRGNNSNTQADDNHYDLALTVRAADPGAQISVNGAAAVSAESRALLIKQPLGAGGRGTVTVRITGGTVAYTLSVLRYSLENAYIKDLTDLKFANAGRGFNPSGNGNAVNGEGLIEGSNNYNIYYRRLYQNLFFLNDITIEDPFVLQIPCNINLLTSNITLAGSFTLKHHYYGLYYVGSISGKFINPDQILRFETPNSFYNTLGSAGFVSNTGNFEKLTENETVIEDYLDVLIPEAQDFIDTYLPDYLLDDVHLTNHYFSYPITFLYEVYHTQPDGSGGYVPSGEAIARSFDAQGNPVNIFDLSGAVNRPANENVMIAVKVTTLFEGAVESEHYRYMQVVGKSNACRLEQLNLEVGKYLAEYGNTVTQPLSFLNAARPFVVDSGAGMTLELTMANNGLDLEGENYRLSGAASFLFSRIESARLVLQHADAVTIRFEMAAGQLQTTMVSFRIGSEQTMLSAVILDLYLERKDNLFADQEIILTMTSGATSGTNHFTAVGIDDQQRNGYVESMMTSMYFSEGKPEILMYMSLEELALIQVRFDIYRMVEESLELYENHPFEAYTLVPGQDDQLAEGYYLNIREDGFVEGGQIIYVYAYISYIDSDGNEYFTRREIIVPKDGVGGDDDADTTLFDRNLSALFSIYGVVEDNESGFSFAANSSNIDVFAEVVNGKNFYDLDIVNDYFPDINRDTYRSFDYTNLETAPFCTFVRAGGSWHMTLDALSIPARNTNIHVIVIQGTSSETPVVQEYRFNVLGRYQRGFGTDRNGIRYIPDTYLYDLMAATYGESGKPYLLLRDAESEKNVFDAGAVKLGSTSVNLTGINYLANTPSFVFDGIKSFSGLNALGLNAAGTAGSGIRSVSFQNCTLDETKLGNALMYTTKLEKVNLDYNNFTRLPQLFRTVKELSLCNNKVTALDGIDTLIPGVTTLLLENNHIANFEPLVSLSSLQEVFIYNNTINAALSYDYAITAKPQYYGTNGTINTPNYVALFDKGVKVYAASLPAGGKDQTTVSKVYDLYGRQLTSVYGPGTTRYQNLSYRNGVLYSGSTAVNENTLVRTGYRIEHLYSSGGIPYTGIYLENNKLYNADDDTEFTRLPIESFYVYVSNGSSVQRVPVYTTGPDSVIQLVQNGIYKLVKDVYDLYQNGQFRVINTSKMYVYGYNAKEEIKRLSGFFDYEGICTDAVYGLNGENIMTVVEAPPVSKPEFITFQAQPGDSAAVTARKAAEKKISVILNSLFNFKTFYHYIELPYYVFEGKSETGDGNGLHYKLNLIEFEYKQIAGQNAKYVTVIVNINYSSYTILKQFEFVLRTAAASTYPVIVRSDYQCLYTQMGTVQVPSRAERTGYTFGGWYYYNNNQYDKERGADNNPVVGELNFSASYMTSYTSLTAKRVVYARWTLNAPTVTMQNKTAVYNGSIHYLEPVAAHDDPNVTFTYQWYRAAIGSTSFTLLSGATQPVYGVSAVSTYQYRVLVTALDTVGYLGGRLTSVSAQATATLTVTAARMLSERQEDAPTGEDGYAEEEWEADGYLFAFSHPDRIAVTHTGRRYTADDIGRERKGQGSGHSMKEASL